SSDLYGRALQAVGGIDVEHQDAIDVAHQGLIIDIGGEQIGVARLHATVAAHVKVPALFRGNHTDILALCLGTFTGAAGHRHLDLDRKTQALVAALQVNRHADAVLHAVATPGAADAGLHRAQ